ncbi:MAG: hypothetical protein IKP61_01205 [Spirochaetales bacterium]|nr:hypothetical protein [Spirochaetales bacterium]
MRKADIISTLSTFPYSPSDYWIITGAAMVMYGIRDQTHDIDLGCTKQMADRLEEEGYLHHISDSGRRCFKYGESIEVFEGWLRGSVETHEGFQIISIKGLIEMKQELGREKDRRDLELINLFLGKATS